MFDFVTSPSGLMKAAFWQSVACRLVRSKDILAVHGFNIQLGQFWSHG